MKRNSGILKRNLIGFLIGIITSGSISVIAATYFPSNDVTYDNSVSGLESTNVQGAIDELYGVCFPPKASDQIIENGQLEKDPYECRYFFTGTTPNNYITFNDEVAGWRIISVECDGTIKIMKDVSLGDKFWDESGTYGSNNWAREATLNTYLNSTYYNSLSSKAQSQIVAKDFSIGAADYDYTSTLDIVNNENSKTWNGKVALPTASEYIRTSNDTITCGTVRAFWGTSCPSTTWMSNINYWWTLSPYTTSYGVFCVGSSGSLDGYRGGREVQRGVRPTLYLKSDIKITGGDGSSSNPYTIE